MVRVRFAPSPTGKLHVGGARTALYNYMFARHEGGKFLLRIEDTDRERSREEFVRDILEGLKWLGLQWDEDIVYQSQNEEKHRELAYKLLEEGKAYLDRYQPEEWQQVREKYLKGIKDQAQKKQLERQLILDPPQEFRHILERETGAIRIKVPDEGNIEFEDLIRGKISYPAAHISDIVILRSNGTPTYNFAVVVDDALMNITHVIRGDDHIPNTPKQIVIYEALGFPVPQFAHLPMILGPDKKKLSKRHGAASVLEYRDMGILPEALFNFLALLGWAPYPDREVVPPQEMIELFDIRKVNKNPAVFDVNKLYWINSQYIKEKSDEELAELIKPFVPEDVYSKEGALLAARLLKDRVKTLKDFWEYGDYAFTDDFVIEEKAYQKHFSDPEVFDRLKVLLDEFRRIEDWKEETIEKVLRETAERLGVKAAKLIHPVRIAVSGKKVGPSLFFMLEALGKDRVIRRIERIIERSQND